MRILITALIGLLFTTALTAQIGLSGGYFSQQTPEWENAIFGENSNQSFLSNGFSAAVDYRMTPFENFRLELHPQVAYSAANSTNNLGEFDQKRFDFNLNTRLYLLSLEADCDCPTFSRDASILEKGFFVQISPGISYAFNQFQGADLSQEVNDLAFKLGLGIGLDIGLSNFVTVTPIIKYNRYFNTEWEGLQTLVSRVDNRPEVAGNDVTDIHQFYAGLHVGIRFIE